jgi:hypothetical protein
MGGIYTEMVADLKKKEPAPAAAEGTAQLEQKRNNLSRLLKSLTFIAFV